MPMCALLHMDNYISFRGNFSANSVVFPCRNPLYFKCSYVFFEYLILWFVHVPRNAEFYPLISMMIKLVLRLPVLKGRIPSRFPS
mmetsp:Transcript_4772/g.6432  ORF Transcript_4772/g.6432 Transcript_4772/m.6432 type:complete len:85 (+) Transcript_4772:361-615(+)